MSNQNQSISIDRSSLWTPEELGHSFVNEFIRVWENPLVDQLVSLKFEDLVLLPLVDGGLIPKDLRQEEFSRDISKRLESYQAQGFRLLDGGFVRGMLQEEEKIPLLWSQMTDSEAYDKDTASIRFDGSIFKLNSPDDNGERVLAPYKSKAHWSFGTTLRFPRLPDEYERSHTIMTKEFTAALKLDLSTRF